MASDAAAPYMLQLLGVATGTEPLAGLDPQTVQTRTFDVLRQILFRLSRERPFVLAVENVHWIDPTSESYFASVADRLASAPILLLTTYRPGYRPPWLDKSYAMQLALRPLSPDDSRSVVRGILGETPLRPAVEAELLAKAEGNPFFLEELARTVVEQVGRQAELVIPDTVQAVLAARIDRLPPAEKRLLQTAAVIGREVPLELLQRIAGLPEAALQESLGRLRAAEFLYQTGAAPEGTHAFQHTLTQAVAYSSLLPAERRALHVRLVEAIETIERDGPAARLDRLAHHAVQGGLWDKALHYLRQAGHQATARHARREATRCFEQALEAIAHLPESPGRRAEACDLQFHLGHVLYLSGEFERALEHYRAAEVLSRELGDDRRLAQVLAGIAYLSGSQGNLGTAVEAGEQALVHARAAGDAALEVWASLSLGRACFALGQYRRAIERTRWAASTLKELPREPGAGPGGFLRSDALAWLALCLARVGEYAEGVARAEEGVRLAEAADSPQERVWAYYCLGRLYLGQGDLGRAMPLLERARAVCQGGDFPVYFPRVLASLGSAYARRGQMDQALPLLEQAVAGAQSIRLRYGHSMVLTNLGETYLWAGRFDDAERLAAQAVQMSRELGARGDEAWALHLVAQIAARREPPDFDRALEAYGEALAVAEELEMRPLEAQCRLAIGTVYQRQGRVEDARAEIGRAAEQLRALDMASWLERAEALLGALPTR
jgi:tetratricopeptide (TPR) repeat protein